MEWLNNQHVEPNQSQNAHEVASAREKLNLKIEWLIRRDMAEVLHIEQTSFEFPWTDEDFLCCLRQRNCIGMVARHGHVVVGFVIFELHKNRLNILNFAVHPEWRRKGVGHQMVWRLIDKLSERRRNEILLEVRERNTVAQVFFRSFGFRAISVIRSHYDDTDEDAYLMQFLLEKTMDGSPFELKNRIAQYYE